ncbi:MAG: L-seryl-tRNA(Sec) selenium transferase, partial [Acidimicrobiales bacterium]
CGGTLPGVELFFVGVVVAADHAAALRHPHLPFLARVVDGQTVCDLRTVDPADDAVLVDALTGQEPG